MGTIKVGNKVIQTSNEDKILFPKSKITKGEIIDYYQQIAPIMIPHIKKRPLSMKRYPNGIQEKGFFQKDAGDYFPDWITTEKIRKKEGSSTAYVLCNNAPTLVYLANQAVLVYHPWLSRVPKLKYPDRLIFDLDPSTKGFAQIRWAAKVLKKQLEDLGLTPFIMTTGSRGVHVVIPLKAKETFDEVKSFAYDVAQLLVNKYPKKFTIEMLKSKRGSKIFIDILRNEWAQTGVAPYSVRAKEKAPVATPIEWKELSTVTPQKYTIKNIFKRLSRKKDPWTTINQYATTLKKAHKKLNGLLNED